MTIRFSSSVAPKLSRRASVLLVQGRSIVQRMTDNAFFPSPTPPLAHVSDLLDRLAAAQIAVSTRALGTVAARNAIQREVNSMLQLLGSDVGRTAQALDPVMAADAIASSGFGAKRIGRRNKAHLEVRTGPIVGTVHLSAQSAGRRVAYEWASSTDGVTWTTFDVTVVASTSVEGLRPGEKIRFRFRAITRAGKGNWSDPVAVLVQ